MALAVTMTSQQRRYKGVGCCGTTAGPLGSSGPRPSDSRVSSGSMGRAGFEPAALGLKVRPERLWKATAVLAMCRHFADFGSYVKRGRSPSFATTAFQTRSITGTTRADQRQPPMRACGGGLSANACAEARAWPVRAAHSRPPTDRHRRTGGARLAPDRVRSGRRSGQAPCSKLRLSGHQ
jgi:hypothetical protein